MASWGQIPGGYPAWLEIVKKELQRKGVAPDSMPDCPWLDWYNDRLNTAEATANALDYIDADPTAYGYYVRIGREWRIVGGFLSAKDVAQQRQRLESDPDIRFIEGKTHRFAEM